MYYSVKQHCKHICWLRLNLHRLHIDKFYNKARQGVLFYEWKRSLWNLPIAVWISIVNSSYTETRSYQGIWTAGATRVVPQHITNTALSFLFSFFIFMVALNIFVESLVNLERAVRYTEILYFFVLVLYFLFFLIWMQTFTLVPLNKSISSCQGHSKPVHLVLDGIKFIDNIFDDHRSGLKYTFRSLCVELVAGSSVIRANVSDWDSVSIALGSTQVC